MTPKEKAIELVNKYNISFPISDFKTEKYIYVYRHAKNAALIAVEEILSETEERDGMRVINNSYWMEVRNEIEKL